MRFYFNSVDNELVITYTAASNEQAQVVIEPFGAIYTGMDSDIQFSEYPQVFFELKEWIENIQNNKKLIKG